MKCCAETDSIQLTAVMEQTDCHIHNNTLKIPAVYLKRTKSADCRWICTVQHEVSVLKLTVFS